jgi:radical SAM protein with 4Fe4S-binding SPASM domain
VRYVTGKTSLIARLGLADNELPRVFLRFETDRPATASAELRDPGGNLIAAAPTLSLDGTSHRVILEPGVTLREARIGIVVTPRTPGPAAGRLFGVAAEAVNRDSPFDFRNLAIKGGFYIEDRLVVFPDVTASVRSAPLPLKVGQRLLFHCDSLVQDAQDRLEASIWLEDDNGKVHGRLDYRPAGSWSAATAFSVPHDGIFRAVVQFNLCGAQQPCLLLAPSMGWRVLASEARSGTTSDITETDMPGWGRLKRAIHRRCKSSRRFNNLVAAIEMRLGCEELISLPQYMAICPTGQCNALCDFCSVTINRTGILKRQLPHDMLRRFIDPVARTVQVFGLEGNGEPTLYRDFLPLLEEVTSGGTDAYLITNASRLTPEVLRHLVMLESVNISLNAATADSHRKVMKLKDFEMSIAAIRTLAAMRGRKPNGEVAQPRISVSFVATRDNIHEVTAFLQLAERTLGVDVVYIRPLSELGNDLGVVEDVRRIVPHASDVADLVCAVAAYREGGTRLDIRCDPATFRSVQPDPVGGVLLPAGFEGRLLAPWPDSWVMRNVAKVSWHDTTVELVTSAGGATATTCPIPVTPGGKLSFRCHVEPHAGCCQIQIKDVHSGQVLAVTGKLKDQPVAVDLSIAVSTSEAVTICIVCEAAFYGKIDFFRLRKPAPLRSQAFELPPPAQWERGVAEARHDWIDGRLRIDSHAAPGLYVLRSYAIPCARGQRVSIAVSAQIDRGALGIGILSETGERFLTTATLDSAAGAVTLEFATGPNGAAAIVVYATTNGGVSATIGFGPITTGVDPDYSASSEAPAADTAVEPATELDDVGSEDDHGPAVEPPRPPSPVRSTPGPTHQIRPRSWLKNLISPRTVYCHKPWTDMHNFAVDGRVDVCCIATGPSQEYYQLGNLNSQVFQDVWNGERAREFRRTVNSEAPLPPCARCPMSHAYQGLWLDPAHTIGRWRALIFSRPALNGLLKAVAKPASGAAPQWRCRAV